MAVRFVDVSESEIDQFQENAVPQKTIETTNHQCNSTKTISRLRRLIVLIKSSQTGSSFNQSDRDRK